MHAFVISWCCSRSAPGVDVICGWVSNLCCVANRCDSHPVDRAMDGACVDVHRSVGKSDCPPLRPCRQRCLVETAVARRVFAGARIQCCDGSTSSRPSSAILQLLHGNGCSCPPDFPQCIFNPTTGEAICCGPSTVGCAGPNSTWC